MCSVYRVKTLVQKRSFPLLHIIKLHSTQPSIQWVLEASSAQKKWHGHTAEHSTASSTKVKNKCSYSLNHFHRLPVYTIVNGSSVSHFIGLFHAQTLKRRLTKLALCTWWVRPPPRTHAHPHTHI